MIGNRRGIGDARSRAKRTPSPNGVGGPVMAIDESDKLDAKDLEKRLVAPGWALW